MAGLLEALDPPLRAAAAELAVALSSDQAEALIAFIALLQRWNATYNLTSVRDPAQMLVQHVVDCLAVVGPLRRQCAKAFGDRPLRLLDVGSGGGLPGVVVAILNPQIEVTCVDTVGKKAAFVQQVAAELLLRNLHARHARVEQMTATPFDVVTSRAFASLADFTRLTRSHLGPNGVWMAMKGTLPEAELAELHGDIDVFHVEQLTVPSLAARRCLVWMSPQERSL